MTHEVILPWPPAELNPNKRLHWSKRSKKAKDYRSTCFCLAKHVGLTAPKGVQDGRIVLWITFFPPDKRRRDDDNIVAAFKAGRDGLAEALGVDDKCFVTRPFVHTQTRPNGEVRVRLTPMPKQEEALCG